MTTQRRADDSERKKEISTKRKGNDIVLFVPDAISYAANLRLTTVCVSNRNIGSLRTADVFPVVAGDTSAVRWLESWIIERLHARIWVILTYFSTRSYGLGG